MTRRFLHSERPLQLRHPTRRLLAAALGALSALAGPGAHLSAEAAAQPEAVPHAEGLGWPKAPSAADAWTQEDGPDAPLGGGGGLGDLDLESLLQVEVTTGSRQVRRVLDSSVPISLITDDDLFYGGFTSVADALRFVPGVDVLYADRNTPMVGVRGLHDQFSERTLLLIDGREASNPLFGGGELFRLPVILQDVERVEVVRGPGGAAWGANAFNGVINVLTKRPSDTPGLLVQGTASEWGSVYGQFRYGVAAVPPEEGGSGWAVRVSGGAESQVSSEDAIAGDDFVSTDGRRQQVFAIAAERESGDGSRLVLDGRVGHVEYGVSEQLELLSDEDARATQIRLAARLEREFSGVTSGYIQGFVHHDRWDNPIFLEADTLTSDLEAQLNHAGFGSHSISFGGNVRHLRVRPNDNPQSLDLSLGEDFDEWTGGAFVIDRWDLTDRVALESQARVDLHSDTAEHVDWSARLTGLLALDDDARHVARVGVARAFRQPGVSLRRGALQRRPLPSPPLPPGTFGLTLNPDDGLQNESLLSLEAGLASDLGRGWTARLDGYVQRYDDLIAYNNTRDAIGLVTAEPDGSGDAVAYGVEAELGYRYEAWQATAWYAFNQFDLDSVNARAYLPASHKVGVSGRWSITPRTVLSLNYRYTGTTRSSNERGINESINVPSHHILDLALTVPAGDRGTFTLGVHDLLDEGDVLATSFAATRTFSGFSPTPGRVGYARLTFEF